MRIGLSLLGFQATGLVFSLLLASLTLRPRDVIFPMIGSGQVYAAVLWSCGAWVVAGWIPQATQLNNPKIVYLASAVHASVSVCGCFLYLYGKTFGTDHSQFAAPTFFLLLFLFAACLAGNWVYLKLLSHVENTAY